MRALLDTHTFLWWNLDDPQLSERCRQIIAEPGNTIYLSVVSAWEIAIKAKLGKLPLPESPELYVPHRVHHHRFEVLPITMEQALHTYLLPFHHKVAPMTRLIACSLLKAL